MSRNFIETAKGYLTVKNVSKLSALLNIVAIVLGILYLSTISVYNMIWDLAGIVFIVAIFANLLLMFLTSIKLNKSSTLGHKMNLLIYIYLLFTILAMFGMIIGNLLISVSYSNALSATGGYYFMVYANYFALLGLGIVISLFDVRNLDNAELWDLTKVHDQKRSAKAMKTNRIVKLILKIVCYFTLAFGIYFAYLILNGSSDYAAGVFGIFIGQFGVLIAFNFLASTILLLKLKDKQKNKRGYYAIALIGLICTGIFMLPMCLSSYTAYSANVNFTAAFGDDWKDIDNDIVKEYFMQTPYASGQYFLGIPPKDCEVEENVKFYDDDDVKLYCDVYHVDNAEDLPGKASVMIRIHGGGWVFGDKGWGDMMQAAKYFAAQGYIVYDIQYRLYDMNGLLDWDPLTPKYRKGDFNMNDIADSLGEFLKYLVENNDYDANLHSVFVTGGSAGGHLTCVLGLGVAEGVFEDQGITSENITIKGIIPFYPGNGVSRVLGVDGKDELVDPTELVDKNSPPCLIYQGTSDGLVNPKISQELKDTYDANGNDECAIIWLHLTGHSNDIYFNGYDQQIFLFYMERFCYLCVEGQIE